MDKQPERDSERAPDERSAPHVDAKGDILSMTLIADIPNTKDDFTGTYLLKSKTVAETKGGAHYLRLRLGDKSGEIDAFVWQDIEVADKSVATGQVIKLKGRVNIYQQRTNVRVLKLRPAAENEYDVRTIVECPKADPEELLAAVKKMTESVSDQHYRALLGVVFSDEEFVSRFKIAPGAKTIHHAYRGGLLEHTVSLLRLATSICEMYGDLDRDLLITSCILHDIGKMQEYNDELAIERTTKGRLLGHIVLGLLSLQRYIARLGEFPPAKWETLLHVLISHHGTLEWGSPQVPMTLEAIALHYIDNLDAKLNQFRTVSKRHKDPNFEGFTTYDKLLERYVYFGNRLAEADAVEG